MSTSNGSKFWKWAVVLLVVCNVGLMLIIWLKPRMPFGHPQGEGPRNFVIQSLKFSDEQVKKYDALINVHKHTMDSLRDQSMQYRQLLFGNLKNETTGAVEADSLAKHIADNQKQIEMVTYNHFAQVRAICTDAQKTEFDRIIGEVTKKMNGNPRNGPPPRGDRPRGPQDDGNPPPPPRQDRPGHPENQ
jgi:hypothetical protein